MKLFYLPLLCRKRALKNYQKGTFTALALTITIPDLPEMILFAIVILLMSAYHLSAFSTCSAVAVSHSAVIFVPSAVYSVCKTTDRSIRKETMLPRS